MGQHYILTGKLNSEYGRLFAQLETLRDRADYDIIYMASEDEVMSFFSKAEELLTKIKELIG